MNLTAVITPELRNLRDAFVAQGFDVRLVGGVVRDLLRGVEPKDIDLCTDANPDEQVAIYNAAGVSYHETGLQHGTITVVLNGEPYEITSLRTETDHDGRHAVVSYTKNWLADLSRRDLTFNAMSLTFDGTLIDPFGGADDLTNNNVVFVGNPDDRMREDYLRILRWFRFHARIANTGKMNAETMEAVKRQAQGLSGISRERVWMEMSKIVVGNVGGDMVKTMFDLGIHQFMDMPEGNPWAIDTAVKFGKTTNPVTAMVAMLNADAGAVTKLATDWKWSAAERDFGVWLAKTIRKPSEAASVSEDYVFLISHDETPVHWVAELARLQGSDAFANALMSNRHRHPVFPVKGQDLLDMGMVPGKAIGFTLKQLRRKWADEGFKMSKEELLQITR